MRECGTTAVAAGSRQRDMKKRTVVVGAAAGLALARTWRVSLERSLVAEGCGAGAARRAAVSVPVDVAKAVKQTVPVRLEALGTVTPIASVAIKARLDSEITAVHFDDGARVKQGDLLFTLDSRADRGRRSSGSRRSSPAPRRSSSRPSATSQRYTELVAKNATTRSRSTTRRPRSTSPRAAAESNKATLENLKVQLELHARSARRSPAASARPTSRSAISCGRPMPRRSRPSTRSRRSMCPSPCRSAICPICARRSRPRPRPSRRSCRARPRRATARSR